MTAKQLKQLIREMISEISTYREKKSLYPKHEKDDDKVIGKFFTHKEFGSGMSVINNTHLPLDIEIEKYASVEGGREGHTIIISTPIKEPILQQIRRMLFSR